MALTFLVADADAEFRSRLCGELREAGCAVQEAGDGVNALRMLRESAPDIIVTEIMLPEADGYEIIAAVRTGHPQTAMIATSARPNLAGLDLLLLASRLGADVTLEKPYCVNDLMEATRTALAAREG